MMDIGSFTSEPQYQRPDDKNDMVHYIPRPVVQQVAPAVAPVMPVPAAVGGWTYLDPKMADVLVD